MNSLALPAMKMSIKMLTIGYKIGYDKKN